MMQEMHCTNNPETSTIGGTMGRSILVIDDDYFMRKLMEVMLQKDGHTVLVAGDAGEAMEMLANNHIDLITCDIMMPDVDGLEFLRLLRTGPDFNNIPVIIITAAGNQQMIHEAVKLGACCVLEKPFTDKDMQKIILKAVS